jgi:hypothetical protein
MAEISPAYTTTSSSTRAVVMTTAQKRLPPGMKTA